MLKWIVTTTDGLVVVGENVTYFKVLCLNLLEILRKTARDLSENSKPSREQLLSCAATST
jgi:hypothetical protein